MKNSEKPLHTLSFIYTLTSMNEVIAFAYDTPYTFSGDLFRYLKKLRSLNKKSLIREETLCRSSCGFNVKLLIINDEIDYHVSYANLIKLFMWKASDRSYLTTEVKKMMISPYSISQKQK